MLKLGLLLILLAGSSLAWWDASFPYRTQVNISNGGSTLSDYQTPLNITNLVYNNTGLVGSWHFSEGSGTKAADSSGLGNDGTLTNGPAWASGKSGGGLQLNGANQYVDAGNGAGLQPSGTGELTIEAWIKRNDGNRCEVVSKSTTGNDAYQFAIDVASDDKLGMDINIAGAWHYSASAVPNNGNWHHVAVVVKGGNYVNFYINGSFDKSNPTTDQFQQNTANALIGKSGRWGTTCNGTIDEVRIYNRSLSATEIQEHYNATKARLDYADLRFALANDTALSYWLESDNKAWVKVPSIPAGTSTIYAYYGNASAASASNYFATFDVLGDGSSGALTVSSANTIVNNYAYLTGNEPAGETTINISNGTGFSNGDEIMIIQIQNYSSGTAGTYEFRKISSGGGTASLTLNAPLKNSYASGTFNSATATAAQIVRVPQHTDVTINPGASITAPAWDGYKGGIIIFRASGAVSIAGSINVIGKGFRDGIKDGTDNDGYPGESYTGKPTARSTLYNLGGGGGVNKQSGYGGDGAGGGGYGTAGQDGGSAPNLNPPGNPGQGGITYGTADLSRIFLGSGGGAPYPQDSEGNGSGIIMLYSSSLDATGLITANGANALSTSAEGSGGGGSGGSIYLVANAITMNNNVNATGGNGDKTAYDSYDGLGGNGGAGRIRISANSLTGTSTPSAYTTGFDTEHNRKYALPEPTSTPGAEEEIPLQFTYRKEILLNNAGSALTDYQISLTIDTAALVAAGKMNSSCSDMRFTDSTSYNTQDWTSSYPYWIESGCDTTSTKIWVKVDSIAASSSKTIYLYYGNASAVPGSSGSDTFLFFDDFSGSLDWANKWSSASQGLYSNVSGMLTATGTTTTGYLINSINTFNDVILETRMKWSIDDNGAYFVFNPILNTYSGNDVVYRASPNTFAVNIGGSPLVQTESAYIDTYYRLLLSIPATGNARAAAFSDDGTIIREKIGTPSSRTAHVAIMKYGTGTLMADWVLVRKYASTEPTAIEQQPDTTAPLVLIQSPTSQAYATATVPVNFTATDDAAVSCAVRLNGTVSSDTCSNYTLTLANGAYTLNVTANDTSGNTNSSQVLFTVSVSSQAQSSSSPQISTISGIADGNVTFTFTPAALRIRAGMQDYPQKALKASAGVNKVQIATRVTSSGQNAPDRTKVTYTINSE